MAKLSLQEQLLKSGLVGSGQAKAAKSEKHKQVKQQQHNKVQAVDDLKEQAIQARQKQAEKDRELNQQRKQEDERKQLAAQVKQLIEQNRLPKNDASTEQSDNYLAYRFTDQNKVKALYVTKDVREQLVNGRLAIVKSDRHYELVSTEVAEKIIARDASFVIVLNDPHIQANKDDRYADYQVPDDLMW